MKNNIKTVLSLLVMGSISFSSCKKYLDNNVEGKVPPKEFFVTAEQAKESVTAMYAQMRKWEMVAFAYICVQEIPSDDAVKGGSQGDATFINDFHTFKIAPTDGQVQDYFKGRYQMINLANQVLENVPLIIMDEGLKERYLAEAKFGRATFYFELVRAFGDVPMPLAPSTALEASTIRVPKAEVYQQIVKDLEEAIPVLPDSYTGTDVGRATKGAARGYLAKVQMYLKNWDKVLEQTNAIISSGRYSLEPDFYKMFRIDHENGPESLFEVQASAVIGNGDLSSSQFSQIQGAKGPGAGFGWGFVAPTDNLTKAFDDAGDTIRKKVTILYRGDITPDGDTILGMGIDEMEGVRVPRYNGKAYVPRSKQVAGVNEGAEQNIRKLRYAEILLIDAEAKLNKGDVAGAAISLNLVRSRAKLAPNLTPTIQDIWNERRLELAMEQDRFFDLVRTGQAATVLAPQNFVANKNEVFPIPQTLIDQTNGTMQQNSKY